LIPFRDRDIPAPMRRRPRSARSGMTLTLISSALSPSYQSSFQPLSSTSSRRPSPTQFTAFAPSRLDPPRNRLIAMVSEASLHETFVVLRVLVADNGSSVNDGLTALLSDIDGISVFGCTQEADKLLALAVSLRPNVVILDVQRREPVSLAVIHRLKALPFAPIVIGLCESGLPALREAVLSGGADHVLVRTDCEELMRLLASLTEKRRS
jgi:CheY-like chemotaxis protein